MVNLEKIEYKQNFGGRLLRAGCNKTQIRYRQILPQDATFAKAGDNPGRGSFATIQFESPAEPPQVEMIYPNDWWNDHRKRWILHGEQCLVCLDLVQFIEDTW